MKDETILRELAMQIAEVASLPVHAQKADLWARHNRLERVRPMVVCFVESAWSELIPDTVLQCEDWWSRGIEMNLRRQLYSWENMRDDQVVTNVIYCPIIVRDSGWGVESRWIRPEYEGLTAARFEPVIGPQDNIEQKIRVPDVSVDWEETERQYQRLSELFDGVLRVEKRGVGGFWFAIMDDFFTWRGIDQAFIDMVDRPEWVHAVMERMTEGQLARLDALESLGALSLNNGNDYVGSGGLGFTNELPQADFDGAHVRPKDMWGHATTQIFAEVSPAMHDEFALAYEKRFLARFGLNCYGCCEPLHKKIDIIRKIPNIRRVSMSPWIEPAEAAAGLRDDIIFSYKPNPAIIAAETWDPDRARSILRDVLEKARGCVVEIVMKDTHTCRGEPHRFHEWTRIAIELAEEYA